MELPPRLPRSPLSLLVAGIRAHDEDDATAPDNLAFVANATDAGADLHACVRGDGRLRLQRDRETLGKTTTIGRLGFNSQGETRKPRKIEKKRGFTPLPSEGRPMDRLF